MKKNNYLKQLDTYTINLLEQETKPQAITNLSRAQLNWLKVKQSVVKTKSTAREKNIPVYSGTPQARIAAIQKKRNTAYHPEFFSTRHQTIMYHKGMGKNEIDLPLGMSPAMFSEIARVLLNYFDNRSIESPEFLVFKGSSVTGVKYAAKKQGKPFDEHASESITSNTIQDVDDLPYSDYDMGLIWPAGFNRLCQDASKVEKHLDTLNKKQEESYNKCCQLSINMGNKVIDDGSLTAPQKAYYTIWQNAVKEYSNCLKYKAGLKLYGQGTRAGNFGPFRNEKAYLPLDQHNKINHNALCQEIESIVGRPVNFAIYPNEAELQWHEDIFENRNDPQINKKSKDFGDYIIAIRGKSNIFKNHKEKTVNRSILIYSWNDLKHAVRWVDETYPVESNVIYK